MPQPVFASGLPAPATLRVDAKLGSPPRNAAFRTKIRVALIAAVVAFLAAAVLATVLAWNEAERLGRLRERGVVSDAIVERKWKSGSKSKTRYVRYAFDCDGRRCSGEASLSSRRWDALAPGQTLRITYDPADPDNSAVGTVTQATLDAHWQATGLGGGGVGLLLLVVLGAWWFGLHRRRALLAEGDLTSARIERIGSPSRKGRRCRVDFTLSSGGGAVQSHRHSVAQKLLAGLNAGDDVPYLVMRHAPKRGAPLGLCLQECQID